MKIARWTLIGFILIIVLFIFYREFVSIEANPSQGIPKTADQSTEGKGNEDKKSSGTGEETNPGVETGTDEQTGEKEGNDSHNNQDTTEDESSSNSILSMKAEGLFLQNITLGMSSDEVHSVLGNPLVVDTEQDGYFEKTNEYEDVLVGYQDDQVISIYYKGPLQLDEELAKLDVQLYRDDSGTRFLHANAEGQVVKINPPVDHVYEVYLVPEDGNFRHYLESGYYTPVEN